MAKYEATLRGNFFQVSNSIEQAILNSGLSAELVDQSSCHMGDTLVQVRVYEKYYWRASNRASLTVTLVAHDQSVFVSAIGSGGGQGPIFKLSWGAEEDFISVVQNVVDSLK